MRDAQKYQVSQKQIAELYVQTKKKIISFWSFKPNQSISEKKMQRFQNDRPTILQRKSKIHFWFVFAPLPPPALLYRENTQQERMI